jgi:L-fucose isomerase-like protein
MVAVDKVGLVALSSSLHNDAQVAALKGEIIEALNSSGKILVEEFNGADRDFALRGLLILTGGVERQALEAAASLNEPIIVLAHPWHNSLPAALEILARLRQEGRRGLVLYGEGEEVAAQLALQARAAAAWRGFAHSRIGLIGRPSDWLVASSVKRERLRELEIELVELETAEVLARVQALRSHSFDKELQELKKGAVHRGEPDEETLEGAIRLYHALREIVEQHELSALTVRCFDLIAPLQNSGCYALSRLNDEGITAGCEGDVQALLSMHLARLLTGQPAFMGNVAQLHSERRSLLLTHCTCPLSLSSSYELRSHFESSLGVGIAAQLPLGPATIFRIGGERLSRLFVVEGTIRSREPEEGLCRTQVLLELDRPIGELLDSPLGNHHVLTLGPHRREIETLFQKYIEEGSQ